MLNNQNRKLMKKLNKHHHKNPVHQRNNMKQQENMLMIIIIITENIMIINIMVIMVTIIKKRNNMFLQNLLKMNQHTQQFQLKKKRFIKTMDLLPLVERRLKNKKTKNHIENSIMIEAVTKVEIEVVIGKVVKIEKNTLKRKNIMVVMVKNHITKKSETMKVVIDHLKKVVTDHIKKVETDHIRKVVTDHIKKVVVVKEEDLEEEEVDLEVTEVVTEVAGEVEIEEELKRPMYQKKVLEEISNE